jgi:simple sugar transport system ATP-binding protein
MSTTTRSTATPSSATAPLFELSNVSKRFGPVTALNGLSFKINSGEILGIMGDNGAGKSTLIKILSGYHAPTQGELRFEGRSVRFDSPADALREGVSTVYQDLGLIDELSIARNFFLGHEPKRKLLSGVSLLDVTRMRKESISALREVGIKEHDPESPIRGLSGGERQAIAIARAWYFGKRVLILDEPTSALSLQETNKVFGYVRAAKARGMAVVLITHNLTHAQEICDRMIVLHHGKLIADDVSPSIAREKLERLITDGAI